MARGIIEFWNGTTGQGAIRTPDDRRFLFRESDLVRLKPADLRRGLVVEFKPDPDEKASQVHEPTASPLAGMELLHHLPSEHPVFQQPPISARLAELLSKAGTIHPGLRLDKYLAPVPKQEYQKDRLNCVVKDASLNEAAQATFQAESRRRFALLDSLGALPWCRTTSTPLTLHLARASMLENAGICLHLILGFPYLHGSGLKGMARAYAETVWLPTYADSELGKTLIDRIFGRSEGNDTAAGQVIFHDSWPTRWPRLAVDIINNHHREYYRDNNAPGDWDLPNPVYFLTLPAGEEFSFALHKRRHDVPDEDLAQACAWLDGALTDLGCGAKTTAGYGRFRETHGVPTIPKDHPRIVEPTTRLKLRLRTPAYLAGAVQGQSDCDLRSATLRGLLRWWWRTMYAGFLNPQKLLEMESLLWGDTKRSGIIQTVVTGDPKPKAFTYHGYLNYGMQDNNRLTCGSGSQWELRLIARSNVAKGGPSPSKALEQALASLWLLCSYGGVGAKGRKGYGSLELDPELSEYSIEQCGQVAHDFRAWGVNQGLLEPGTIDILLPSDSVKSACLDHRIGPFEWGTSTRDSATLIQHIDTAYAGAVRNLDRAERSVLGLPRKGQGRGDKERHASPVHLHVTSGQAGDLAVRAIAFPSAAPEPGTHSRRERYEILIAFLTSLEHGIREQDERSRSRRGTAAPRAPERRRPPAPAAPGPTIPKSNDAVEARLLPERTRKGGWRAIHEPTGYSGPVVDSAKIPDDKQAGDVVRLLVGSVNEAKKEMTFKTQN